MSPHPKISTLLEHSILFKHSNAPNRELQTGENNSSFEVVYLEIPKSISFILEKSYITFNSVISRCAIFFSCKYSTDFNNYSIICLIS